MKRAIVILLCICMFVSSGIINVFADTEYDEKIEKLYYYNRVVVKVNTYIDPEKYTGGSDALFCGVLVDSVEFLHGSLSEAEIKEKLSKDGYIEYIISGKYEKNANYLSIKLSKNDKVIDVHPYYAEYPYDKCPGQPIAYFIDGVEYNAFMVTFSSSEYIDVEKCGKTLFGINIKKSECIDGPFENREQIDTHLNNFGVIVYVITFEPPVSTAEVLETLNNVSTIESCESESFAVHDEAPGTYISGDVNDDGKIDSMDYVLLKRAYFGTYILDGNAPVRADININDVIDTMDYVLLKRAYFGTYVIE